MKGPEGLDKEEIKETHQKNNTNKMRDGLKQMGELKTKINSIQKSEIKEFLDENVKNPMGHELIIDRIAEGKISSKQFGEWHANKMGAKTLSPKIEENLNKAFEAIQNGKAKQKIMAMRMITLTLNNIGKM